MARARSIKLPQVEMKAPVPTDKPRAWFTIQNKSVTAAGKSSTRVEIYDEIGGWYYGVNAQDFAAQLKEIDTDQIELHINSPGGAIFDGIAIYNALLDHPAEVIVVVDALAASAASFIAQAGDEIYMTRNAVMMIHDGSASCWGNASDMQKTADLLNMLSDNIADIYSQRGGGTAAEFRELMKEEVWYSAEEAVTAKLADKVLDLSDKEAEEATNRWDLSIFAHAGRENAPSPTEVRQRVVTNLITKEKPVSGTPKNDSSEGTAPTTGPETTPAEGAGGTPTPAPDGADTETEEEVETEEVGKDGDGQPVEGTQPANRASTPTFKIGGQVITDPVAVQRHIDVLETSAKESKDTARKNFVENLANKGLIPAPNLTKTQTFVLGLSDEQYAQWTEQYDNAVTLPLFGRHGTSDGGSSAEAQLSTDAEIETLEAIVRQNKLGGMSDRQLAETPSFKKLQHLKSLNNNT